MPTTITCTPGPAREAIWQALVTADVDMINTDDLEGLRRFLLEYTPNLPKESLGAD